jgi:hypothetical protein
LSHRYNSPTGTLRVGLIQVLAGMKHLPRRFSLVLLLTVAVSACFWERPESSYSTFAEAERSGAVEKGWIPAWVPSSATNIREMHDIDTNESMLAFTYESQGWELPAHCRQVSYSQVTAPRFSRNWWPAADLLEKSYEFFRCKGDVPFSSAATWVGRHNSAQQGLHWRAYAR